jgi:hypothetical protein
MDEGFENFRTGFLGACKEAGLNDQQTETIVDNLLTRIKSADFSDYLQAIPGYPAVQGLGQGLGRRIGQLMPDLGVGAYIGLPLVGGAAAGAGLAKLQDLNDEDPAEVRTRESIDSYRNLARQMAIRDKLRMLNRPTRARSPLIR